MVTALYKAVWMTLVGFGVAAGVLLGVHKYGSVDPQHAPTMTWKVCGSQGEEWCWR